MRASGTDPELSLLLTSTGAPRVSTEAWELEDIRTRETCAVTPGV